MRNFDFKRYTPRPEKLLRASLKDVAQGFCFSCLKAFPVLISRGNLKAAIVKFQSENILQESASLSCKTEFKIEANPGLA